ncbi:hypothetical protein [Pantoea sp. BAV 3049]|uniref:hypothetical protein n=1 Tax=Pantoea sp. BAV 3049 TaxID=2654188 RepID=UPI00131D870C|nr:hypothetical protein [Pantoea sp. BAV 3049]
MNVIILAPDTVSVTRILAAARQKICLAETPRPSDKTGSDTIRHLTLSHRLTHVYENNVFLSAMQEWLNCQSLLMGSPSGRSCINTMNNIANLSFQDAGCSGVLIMPDGRTKNNLLFMVRLDFNQNLSSSICLKRE